MNLEARTKKMEEDFFALHTDLQGQRENILAACTALADMYRNNGALFTCGNGGSAADSEHIVGELMKGFLLRRPLPAKQQQAFQDLFGQQGADIAAKLQMALPAVSLTTHSALMSAFENDVDPTLVYAQQVYGYGNKGDALLGISTSGNAENVAAAVQAATVKGLITIGLTGRDGGKLKQLCDICIVAPAKDTYRIQEYHLVIYHFICAYLESVFFET